MKLSNETQVAAPPDRLFALLADVEQVAGCLPGAGIEGRDGEDFIGAMKVKVGPITAAYRGTIGFLELDESGRRAVLKARAQETNGNGDAEAVITTSVVEAAAGGSRLQMETDLQIRGRMAQLGRGAMERISQQLFEQFARNVESAVVDGGFRPPAGGGAAPAGGDTGPRPQVRTAVPPEDGEALDAVGLFLTPQMRRTALVVGAWAMGFAYGYLAGRLRRGRT
ncbi:MAG: SRPBCC family protein [Actinobacteria bacterium]|nr:SRPBCC family protein [Actinomycetota bacterium]